MTERHGSMDVLTEAGVRRWLTVPLRPEVQTVVTSTNRLLRERAAGEPEGLVLLAEEQTAGRGRFDRRFYSPAGTGLYLSVLLRPTLPVEQTPLLTIAAAVAVTRALEAVTGASAGIKWVNDVYLSGRKVCGILTEAALEGDRLAYAVVGIGVNVYAPPGGFPPELAGIAGAVMEKPSAEPVRCQLAAAVLNEFWHLYTALPRQDFMEEYRARSVVLGREITVHGGDGDRLATALAITEEGHLSVRYADGSEGLLGSGEISISVATGTDGRGASANAQGR